MYFPIISNSILTCRLLQPVNIGMLVGVWNDRNGKRIGVGQRW